ncbi:MAG: methyltransferase [Bradymonadia bacterium]
MMTAAKSKLDIIFTPPQGQFTLRRYGHPKSQLRAWNGADHYLLERLATELDRFTPRKTLIINDDFGALTIPLLQLKPDIIINSAHGQRALQKNLSGNSLNDSHIRVCTQYEFEANLTFDKYDLVVMKLPKSLAALEEQLRLIHQRLHTSTKLFIGSMAKHIQQSVLNTIRNQFGSVDCSLAKRRARIISVKISNLPATVPNLRTRACVVPEAVTGLQQPLTLTSFPGTFGHGKLDRGTQALLEVLELPSRTTSICDYGSGTGVLGIVAGLRHPDARLLFVDDAAAAVQSTQWNVSRLLDPNRDIHILHRDTLDEIPSNSQHVILSNPPFHDSNARTEHIAHRMFHDAFRVLEPGGELWVVANRHLRYAAILRKLFGRCEHRGKHPKFIILKASKTNENAS